MSDDTQDPQDTQVPACPQPVPEDVKEILKFQWIPDHPDHRDMVFSSPMKPAQLPEFVDIIGIRNKIENQLHIGSCTGCSSTSALEIAIGTKRPFSKLMAYYLAREQRGTIHEDSGASIRNVMKGIADNGVAYEETHPYVPERFQERPSAQAYQEARALVDRMWGFEYLRLHSLNDIKGALAAGYPVTFGFATPEVFSSPYFNNFLRFPTSQDKIEGGHAVVAVGYDDRGPDKFVWVRNSWGKEWGINGYFKMSQDWFTNPNRLADDFWVIRRKANPVKP